MGVVTITIARSKPNARRTRDKGPDLAALYRDLYDRLHAALEECQASTHDDYNPADHPHAPGGQSNGGQFVSTGGGGPTGPKPTSVKAKLTKAALHELLSTGHAFSKKELLDIMGPDHKDVTVSTWLSKFKSQKHAGEYGALDIKKLPNGSYQVVMPDGSKAPPAPEGFDLEAIEETPLKDLLVKPPKVEPMVMKHDAKPYVPKVTVPFAPVSKEKADKSYAFSISNELGNAQANIEDGMEPIKAAMKFKQAKALAMAQWLTNTTGKLHEPKQDDKVYKADQIFANELHNATEAGIPEGGGPALANWKKNTALEKQGKLGAPEQPKPETKTLGKALAHWADDVKDLPAPAPKPYEHLVPAGFKHISPKDFTASGKNSFGYQIQSLKKELAAIGNDDAVSNKKMVEKGLQEKLKDKKHYQALRALYEKTSNSGNSLERRLIETWASSSGDSNNLSCALQVATQDAFAQPKDAVTHEQLHAVKTNSDNELMMSAASHLGLSMKNAEDVKAFRQGLQEFIHGQYENTQDLLKKMGKDHVMVARGMKHDPGKEHFSDKPANVKLQPASSFSANYGTASSFAGSGGTVYLCKIPASQVLGTYLTGFGCTSEHEVVVLGHDTIKSFPVKKDGHVTTLATACERVTSRIESGEMKK